MSGREQAKPAQPPILSIRAVSKAFYSTFHGRRVHAAGFVDDTEHYGSGSRDLATIMRELSLGSVATGIGYTWPKFTAFATDWNEAITSIRSTFSPDGIQVTGWDIWKGGIINAVVPRAQADTIEKFSGKR